MQVIEITPAQEKIAKDMGFDYTRFIRVYDNGVYLFCAVNAQDFRAIQREQRREKVATEAFANWP